jgi:hypothetical protein
LLQMTISCCLLLYVLRSILSSLNLTGENKGMLQKLSCTRPQCGLPLETLEEKILALMRKMHRDGRVWVSSSNVEQCNYLLELVAPGTFTSRHFNHSAANTRHISLPVITRLTNDLRAIQ